MVDKYGLPPLPLDLRHGTQAAMAWLQGAARRRDGQARDEEPRRDPHTLRGWDDADAFYNAVKSCPTCKHNDPRWCNRSMNKGLSAARGVRVVRHRADDAGRGIDCPEYEVAHGD